MPKKELDINIDGDEFEVMDLPEDPKIIIPDTPDVLHLRDIYSKNLEDFKSKDEWGLGKESIDKQAKRIDEEQGEKIEKYKKATPLQKLQTIEKESDPLYMGNLVPLNMTGETIPFSVGRMRT